MKKQDLIAGLHVVECINGERYLYCGNGYLLGIKGFNELKDLNQDLNYQNKPTSYEYNVFKVYEVIFQKGLSMILQTENLKLIWQRQPIITHSEVVILLSIDANYKYLARDNDGCLHLYQGKPTKSISIYKEEKEGNVLGLLMFNHLFKMVNWEDLEPTLISDLLIKKIEA